jgi:hypothetical protein
MARVGHASAHALQPGVHFAGSKCGMPSTPSWPFSSPVKGQPVLALPFFKPNHVHNDMRAILQ